jgi:long-subunit fatty acid transport protein
MIDLRHRRTALGLLATVATVALVTPAHAQDSGRDRTATGGALQFSSSPPGARSLGMGSTFIGIADDATAAEANPAGLTILKKPEVSVHFRHSSFDVQYEDWVTGNGQHQTFTDNVTAPSFASLVVPAKRAALSVYYHESANFLSHSALEGVHPPCDCYVNDETTLGIQLHNIGFAGAFKLGPQVSIGGSLRVTRLEFDNHETLFIGPTSDIPTEDVAEFRLKDGDTRIAFNAGVMFNPGGKFSGGLVFKQGREYDLDGRLQFNSRNLLFGGDLQNFVDAPVRQSFKVPHVFGGGVAFRPTDTWIAAADIIRSTYSDLRVSDASIPDDETEVHFGLEYTTLVQGVPLSVRGGLYTDPDHDSNPDIDSGMVHVTFGAGVVLAENFQLDGAVSLADRLREGLMSMVWRF